MVRAQGLRWTVDTVSQLEVGRRGDLTLSEMAALAHAFKVDPWAWFAGEGDIQLNEMTTVDRAGMRNLLGSRADHDKGNITNDYTKADRHTLRAGLTDLALMNPPSEAELHAAETLHAPVSTIKRSSMDLWGQSLDRERDSRLKNVSRLTARERQARRGHVTRGLLAELAEALPKGKRR